MFFSESSSRNPPACILPGMRILLIALLAHFGLCQTAEDASTLLHQVAEKASTATAWQIEGATIYPKSGADPESVEPFKLLIGKTGELRFEQDGKSAPALIICNTASAWLYSPALNRFRVEAPTESLCSPLIGQWRALPVELRSPVLAGTCGPDPSAKASAFQLIRGFADPEIVTAGRIARTLCIDATRNLIVWENWQSRYGSRTNIYSRFTQSPPIAPDAFSFTPPPGSEATDLQLPMPRPLGSKQLPVDRDVILPRVVSRSNPVYGEQSRKAGIEGTILLYVVVGTDGRPSDVLVFRPLSPDLNTEAVRSVRKWRFSAGTKNGLPVAVPMLVEINFQLAKL